ncbi:MAG TPA: DNA helicase, partial [Anaeromyxobacter sp.]
MRPRAGVPRPPPLKERVLTRKGTEALAADETELTPAERAIVEEEEALLAAVKEALVVRRVLARVDEKLVARLRDLREEALESTAKDLPTVFQEMGVVRAVMERARPGDLPDPAAPYFAHLRIREDGEERDYCLGRHTFVDRETGVRVVDWRWAPVAALFYRYREGEEYEEPFPGRVSRGTVAVRRVVVVDREGLARVAADGVALVRGPGGAWRATRGA